MIRRLAYVGWLVACLAAQGCGSAQQAEAKKYPVTGAVTLDGVPLPEGDIYFKTIATGAIDIMPVKNGKFEGEAQAGSRRVEIYAYREGMSEEMKKMYGDSPPPGTSTKENIIPARWNAESALTADVKETGSNEFKFEIAK